MAYTYFMKNTAVNSQTIFIDGEELSIPIAILNKKKRKTILITAGIDGDEYAGIEAAYRLINDFEKLKTDYRLIIIPLVNIFGNKEGVSHNPRDGRYPKYIYPGKKNGSSSEQLIFHLDKFISQSFLWIDLHSGSKDERLNPFIWIWQTKNKNINDFTLSSISNFQNDEIIYQKNSFKKVEELAKRNIAYIMFESGELGEKKEDSIKKHIDWVKKIVIGKTNSKNHQVYRKVKFYKANKNGAWQPKLFPGKIDQEKLAGLIEEKEITSQKGLIIYIKEPKPVEKREEIFAVAYDKETI